MDAVGQILGDRYRVERFLGSGRFASVYVATDTWQKTRCALKIFRPSTEKRAAVGRRFFRRTRLALTSPHPVIVPFIDNGRTPEGVPFLVMELLEGRSLHEELESSSALMVSRSLHIVNCMLEGLAAIHDEGLVHRDINPSNVFLVGPESATPTVRILDFGVAQDLVDYLAIAPSAFGSTRYLAPEILLDAERAWTPAVDVFAAGMVLFQMLTGRLPFDKEAYVGSGKNTINAYASLFKLPAPSKFAPHLPRPIDAVVQQSIAVEQWERYKNAREMLDALRSSLTKVDLSAIDAERSMGKRQLLTREAWLGDDDDDDDLTIRSGLVSSIHEYVDGDDDPTTKTVLPEEDDERTEEAEPPRAEGGRASPPSLTMEEEPAFDVERILDEHTEEELGTGTNDETLDQNLDERARLLLDQEGGLETPLRVLEKLYAAGVNIDTTLVDPKLEETFDSVVVGVEERSLPRDDELDDDVILTRPLPQQSRSSRPREIPPKLEHYEPTKEIPSLATRPRGVASIAPSPTESGHFHSPQGPLNNYLPPDDSVEAMLFLGRDSPRDPPIPIRAEGPIVEDRHRDRLSSFDMKLHFPSLIRRKIALRALIVISMVLFMALITFFVLYGFRWLY